MEGSTERGTETPIEGIEGLALAGSTELFMRARTPTFRKVTAALVAAGFSTYAMLYCVQPLLPVFSAELHVGPSVSSLSLSLTTGTLAVAMLLAGRLSDVRGRKPIMAASLFAVGLLTAACAFAPSWPLLLGLRTLTGVALAGVPAVAMAYLAEEVHPHDLGAAMGLYIAGNAYGGMVGRVLTGALVDLTGSWRWALGIVGLLGVAAATAFVALLPPSRRFTPETGLSLRALGRAFATHGRDRVLRRLYLVGFLLMGAFVTAYNYLSYRLLLPPFGLSQALSGAIFLVYLLGGPASAWFGRLSSRRSYGRTMMGRTLMAALLLLLVGLALTAGSSLAVNIAGLAVFTAGFFGAHSIASGWVSERARTARAAAASLYLFAYYLGSSVFGSLGGLFWSRDGWPGVMALVGGLVLLTLAVAASLMRSERRDPQRRPA